MAPGSSSGDAMKQSYWRHVTTTGGRYCHASTGILFLNRIFSNYYVEENFNKTTDVSSGLRKVFFKYD
jgi:hypothetical protein